MNRSAIVARSFYARNPVVVAPDLIGKILTVDDQAGRIVEVEAYCGSSDPASHGYRGPTPRTAVMFGPPGNLYVYFSYGMHWCANVVCDADGVCGAVLIRALEPLCDVAAMWQRRPAARLATDLCSGPAKLCSACGITGADDGTDVTAADGRVQVRDDGFEPPEIVASRRIGLAAGKGDLEPWRFHVAGNPHVSRSATGGAMAP